MADAAGGFVVVLLFAIVGVGGPIVLYALVRDESERNRSEELSREEAERIARRDEE